MDLRTKTLVTLLATLIVATFLILVFSSSVFLSSYAGLDEDRVRDDTLRAVNAVNNEIGSLHTVVTDYAAWDDTYRFMAGEQGTYIASNFVDATFENLGLNLLLVIDTEGRIVYGSGFDLEENRPVPVPDEIITHLGTAGPLSGQTVPGEGNSGLLFLSEGPMMVAAHPILHSDHAGPSRGAIIMGRYMDEEMILRLEETIALPVTTYAIDDASLPPTLLAEMASIGGHNQVIVRPQDHDLIEGYTALTDIYGNEGLILRIEETRDIFHQGERTLLYYLLTILAIGAIAGLMMIHLLDRTVLARLAFLSSNVATIGSRADPSHRVIIDGDDELSRLAYAINTMLARIEEVQRGLQESEARYRGIVNDQVEMILRCRPDGIVTFANDVFCRYLGRSCTEIIGRRFPLTLYNGDAGILTGAVSALTPVSPATDFTVRVIMAEGEIRWQQWTLRAIFSDSAGVIEYQAVGEDITERKRAEEALSESRERLNLAVNGANLGVWDWNLVTNRVTFNESGPMFGGYSPAEIGGNPENWQRIIHPDDLPEVRSLLGRHLRGESEVFESVYRLCGREGRVNWIRNTGKVVRRDDEGSALRMTGIWQDITDIRRYQEGMIEANKKLNLLNSITRHDILNQVTALLGYVDLSSETVTDETLRRYLGKMHQIGRTIQGQIEFTRDYQELGVHGPVWQDVERKVRDAAALMDTGGRVIECDLKGLVIYADPLLERVFFNLIDNTLNHGGPAVTRIRIFGEEDEHGYTLVYEDNGKGVPEAQKNLIFRPGYGTINGYGLFLITEILGITGMTIRERGIPGTGARFEIRIPPGGYRRESPAAGPR